MNYLTIIFVIKECLKKSNNELLDKILCIKKFKNASIPPECTHMLNSFGLPLRLMLLRKPFF